MFLRSPANWSETRLYRPGDIGFSCLWSLSRRPDIRGRESIAERETFWMSDSLLTRIVSNLLVKKFWSPEQIQYRLRKELPNLKINATTIYRGINSGFLEHFADGRKSPGTCGTTVKRVTVKAWSRRGKDPDHLQHWRATPGKLRTGLAWGIGKAIPSSGKRAEPASRLKSIGNLDFSDGKNASKTAVQPMCLS